MKKTIVSFLAIAGLAAMLLAFKTNFTGGIKGKVSPIEGVNEVIVFAGADTLTSQFNNGGFVFTGVKRGVYTLVIKTNVPYKTVTVKNVAVIDSATTDVGEIKLLQ